ncbi:GNAT family N-acetyltransferase [Pontivivens insulae]|uniref:N-acetyltransferase domain-containing protein n=1 Tax=Pontivivens insulae TaxID=1639689 RepID=A0A2R8AET3_9RHOB|nr:GNAT family N-acetyltransferase [Pontivivens insulae]RED12007.1 acetyltransferase (GNAT) family protein [Pontivivens insulae]SPF30763.1 hypothetical protein POI8812_03106 [Pontivivens insulae]
MTVRIEITGPSFAQDAAVLALLHTAFAPMDGRIDPPSSLHRTRVHDIALHRVEQVLLVARHADMVVGCAFLSRRADHAYLGKLAVHPRHQGQGIARRLIDWAIELADRPVLRLETRVELVDNQRAFKKLGFVEVARTSHPGYDRPTSVTLERLI